MVKHRRYRPVVNKHSISKAYFRVSREKKRMSRALLNRVIAQDKKGVESFKRYSLTWQHRRSTIRLRLRNKAKAKAHMLAQRKMIVRSRHVEIRSW